MNKDKNALVLFSVNWQYVRGKRECELQIRNKGLVLRGTIFYGHKESIPVSYCVKRKIESQDSTGGRLLYIYKSATSILRTRVEEEKDTKRFFYLLKSVFSFTKIMKLKNGKFIY